MLVQYKSPVVVTSLIICVCVSILLFSTVKGMFAIGWLELGEAEKAQLLLEKCFKNIQGPFQVSSQLLDASFANVCECSTLDYILSQVWSESSDGSGAVNFLTGMGGFLQAVLFGYTGFRSVISLPYYSRLYVIYRHKRLNIHILFFMVNRVQKECLAFSPLLPNDISELCVRGVNYLGQQMDWLLRKEEICIILWEHGSKSSSAKRYDLQVVLKASGTKIPLIPGNTHAQTCNKNKERDYCKAKVFDGHDKGRQSKLVYQQGLKGVSA